MKIYFFPTTAVVLILTVVFFKIYQQNAVIKLRYERQRLDHELVTLRRRKDERCIQLAALKNYQAMQGKATSAAMAPLMLSRIITFTGVTCKAVGA